MAKGSVFIFETNGYIKYIGIGLALLGWFYLQGLIHLNLFSIFSYSISGYLFIAGDFFDFYYEKAEKFNEKRLMKFYDWNKRLASFLAILFITLFPYFHPNISDSKLDKFNNTILLIGLGLTILLIGFKSDKNVIKTIDKFGEGFIQLQNKNEKLKIRIKELEKENNELKNNIE